MLPFSHLLFFIKYMVETASSYESERRGIAGEIVEKMKKDGVVVLGVNDREAFLAAYPEAGKKEAERLWKSFEDMASRSVFMSRDVRGNILLHWKGSDEGLHRVVVPVSGEALRGTPAKLYRDMKMYSGLRILPAHDDIFRGYEIADADPSAESTNFSRFIVEAEARVWIPRLEEARKKRDEDRSEETGL